MKVIVAGLRNFNNYEFVEKVLDKELEQTDIIVCGSATGIDEFAKQYAISKNMKYIEIKAEWEKYGRSAGPIRNKRMAEVGERLIAIWNGTSRGTKSIVEIAKKKGINTKIYNV